MVVIVLYFQIAQSFEYWQQYILLNINKKYKLIAK